MRLTMDKQTEYARELVDELAAMPSATSWPTPLLTADQSTEEGIAAQRERVVELKARLRRKAERMTPAARRSPTWLAWPTCW